MSGFSSQDNMIQKVTQDGQYADYLWNKNALPTTAHAAGAWYCLLNGGGNPPAATVLGTGTNLSMQTLVDTGAINGALPHGGDVGSTSDDFKVLLTQMAFSAAATTMPAILQWVDLLAFWPITTSTSTGVQALINSVTFTADNITDVITHTGYDIASITRCQLTTTTTLPAGLSLATDYWTVRQSATTSKLATSLANAKAGTTIDFTTDGTGTHTLTVKLPRYATGAGVQAFLTPSTVMGAGTPTNTLVYQNSAGTASRTTPTSPSLPVSNATAPVGQISYSGTGVGKYGPFMPLMAGDAGIRLPTSIQYSATHTSGVENLVLCKALGPPLPLTTVGVAGERDLVNQFFSMPRVYNGANMALLMYAGAATPVNSSFFGHMGFGWGN